jgi:hypothetical protein
MSPSPCAIIHISTYGKNFSKVNYSRRMYAIIRRYTPEAVVGKVNECYADLTGLRTFFKMSYKEIAENILRDLTREIGTAFNVKVTTPDTYERIKHLGRKEKSFSTYKELNGLFAGRSLHAKKGKFIIPFLGKVK